MATTKLTAKPTKDTPQTELVLEPGTQARVREIHKGDGTVTKDITYPMNVEAKEATENEDTDESGDNGEASDIDLGLPFIDEPPTQAIPKTKIEIMFDHIRSAIIDDNVPDAFLASCVRQPDDIETNYYTRCDRVADLGFFQFSSRDRFAFMDAVHKRNDNSGGIFNIRIYRQDRQELILNRRVRGAMYPVRIEVGMTDWRIPNPSRDLTETSAPQSNGNANGIERILLQHMEDTNRHFEQLLMSRDTERTPSELEQAMTRKMINDMVNPAPPPDPFAGIAGMMFAAQRFQDRLTDVILPPRVENAPVPEPDWMDKGEKLLNSPGAVAILERLGDITERITVAKLAPNAAPVEYETGNDDDNMELITKIIYELNSDSILNGENETIVELATNYPSEFEDLRLACMSPFEIVLKQLTRTLGKKKPEVLQPFLDVAATQTKGLYVFNPSGDHLVNRLREFHAFINSLNETPVE